MAVTRFVSFGGWDWEREGYTVSALVDTFRGQFGSTVDVLDRVGGPALLGGLLPTERRIEVDVSFPDGWSLTRAYDRFVGMIRPLDPNPRRLVATRPNDEGGTDEVSIMAVVEDPYGAPPSDGHGLRIVFVAVDPTWRETTPTTFARTVTGVARDVGLPVPNTGQADVHPVITLTPTALRSTSSGAYGWKYRKQVHVTNNTDVDWVRRPICLTIGDTAALLDEGKLRIDNADLRVWFRGEDLPRALMAPNSALTKCWVVPPLVKAGETVTFDVVYGNDSDDVADSCYTLWQHPLATDPYNTDKPAFHINGDWGLVASSTSTVMTALNKSWGSNCWSGSGLLYIVAGKGKGQVRQVASNTANTVTITKAWTITPDSTSVFYVQGKESGEVASATSTTLTRNGTGWMTNWWRQGTVRITGGTGAGQGARITGNNSGTLTISGTWGTTPDATSTFSIYASDENTRNYVVEQQTIFAGHGLWHMDHWTPKPGRINHDTPGAWQPYQYLGNRDDFNAQSYSTYGSSPIKRNARIEAERWRQNQVGLINEGQHDGYALYEPQGIVALVADFEVTNQTDDATGLAVGMATIRVRERAGEDWESLLDYTTIQDTPATISATSYTPSTPYPKHMYIGVLPLDEVEIGRDAGANKVQINNNTVFRVQIDNAAITIDGPGSEEEIHDLYSIITSIPSSLHAPRYEMSIGGAGLDVGAIRSGRIAIPLGNHLVIDCANRTVEEWNSDRTVKVGDRLWAVAGSYVLPREDGAVPSRRSQVWPDWLPLPPGRTPLANPSAETDVAGWTLSPTGGTTAALTRNASTFSDAAGSFQLQVTATSASTGSKAVVLCDDELPCAEGELHWASMDCRTGDADVRVRPIIRWFTAGGATIATDFAPNWSPATNTWYRRAVAAEAPAGAAYFKVGWSYWDNAGSQTTTVLVDDVHVDDATLGFNDNESTMDTGMTVTVEFRRAWL